MANWELVWILGYHRLKFGTILKNLDPIMMFAKVVEHGSFAAAARSLKQPKATVSRKLAELERELGVRLLNRTTRALSLTDVGRRYFEHAQRIAVELEAADRSIVDTRAEPSGTVRVTAPLVMAQGFLAPVLGDYARSFPKVRIALEATNRRVDIVEEGFDVAIRVGVIADSRLVVRRLGLGIAKLYASPSYLMSTDEPVTPRMLSGCALIDNGLGSMPEGDWTLTNQNGEPTTVKVTPMMATSDTSVALQWALAGHGVARLPEFVAAPHLARKALQQVLTGWAMSGVDISVVFASTRGLTPAVRQLIDLLVERISPNLQ